MALTKIPSSLLDTSGGFDLQGNITLGDNEQIQLGADGDLAIYHDGSNSYIAENGTGDLYIKATNLILGESAGEQYLVAYANGSVTLYHDNNPKIATSATGATVTGNLAVTGDLDITGNVNSYNVTDLDVTDQTITLGAGQTEANSGGSGIIIDGSNASLLWNEAGNRFDLSSDLKIGAEDSGQFSLEISGGSTGTAEGGELRLNTAADYDGTYNHYRLDVYEDDFRIGRAGQTDLNIDSAGRVQIGTTTASGLLNVDGNLHYGGQLRVNDPSHDGTESNPSICVGYDNDNGFFRPTSNTIGITTAGTERMRITASGNVGIATDNPAEKLDVQGDIKVGTGLKIAANTTSGNIGFNRDPDSGAAYTAGLQRMQINGPFSGSDFLDFQSYNSSGTYTGSFYLNAGKVGIGTSNPQMGLHVGSGSQSTSALPGIGIANGGSSYSFYSASDGTKQYIAGIDHTITYTKAGSLSNHSHAIVSNNTIRLFCKNDGFLGIGDVDPDSTVHIKNSTAGGPQIHMDDGTNSAFINFDGTSMQLSTQRDMVDGTWHNTAKSWGGINIQGNTDGSKITMTTAPNANTSPSTRFIIDKDGHVIIGGNYSEAGKVSVYTDSTNDPALYGYRSTSEFKIVPFLSNGAFSSLSSVNDSGLFFSDNFIIAKHASGNYGMKVEGGGNVHIGTKTEATGSTGGVTFSADNNNRRNLICATTTTGTVELVEFRNPNGTVGDIRTSGTSTSYVTSSDYRLKENVTYEFNALDRVTQLKPARFNFITDADTVLDGFLAHEVSDIVPEAVSGEKDATKEKEVEVTPAQYEDDGETLISEAVMETRTVPVYQGIDHSKLVPLLTKAIQELKTELDAAKARITELEG